MTAPFNTSLGYGNPTINTDGSQLSDGEDGIPVIGPSLAAATGALAAIVIDPRATAGGAGIPPINALIVELRVLNALLHMQLGATQLDLEQMRADELYNTTIGSGVV